MTIEMENATATATARPQSKRGPRKGVAGRRGAKPKITKDERRKKYTDIARNRREKQKGIRSGESRKASVCYSCRLPGHNAANCPSLGNEHGTGGGAGAICTPVSKDGISSSVLCYKCGSTEHALHHCPKRYRGNRSDLPFATCFVCNEKGHLASACSKNTTGIYVNGGSCRTCGSQYHLASDCPEKKKKRRDAAADAAQTKKEDDERALLDDLLQVEENPSSTISKTKQETKDKKNEKKLASTTESKKKNRVVNF